MKALGAWFSVDTEKTAFQNYDEKLDKIRNILSCWKYRRLTLIGKIAVLKESCCVSTCLYYVLSPFLSNAGVIKEVNRLYYAFLWNGKGDKIKRNVIINDLPKGGRKMINIESFNKSLKATWVKKYLDQTNQGKWKLFFFYLELNKLGGVVTIKSNLNIKDASRTLKINSPFLNDVLSIWAEVNFEDTVT